MADTNMISPLGMSDEELMKLDPSQFMSEPSNSQPQDTSESFNQPELPEEELEEEQEDQSEENTEEEGTQEEEESQEADDEEVSQEQEDVPAEAESAKDSEPQAKEEEKPIDYEAEYKRLFAPIKANGREVRLKSMDDAIALIQMGINYNKKMAGLKPHLRILKMLEKQNLLNEEELSHLIDLKHKKPGAIEKLLKDSEIDPMDLNAENADQYTPSNYSVSETEIELDNVIEEIKHTPAFNRTVDIVSNHWDAKSKDALAEFPQGLKIINDHVERGIYDLIMNEVEYERRLGRLQGLSDLEAYRQVGDMLQAQGAFNHLGRQATTTPVTPKVVVPNPKKEEDSKLRQKRRAASPTKSGGAGAVKQEFNPLALSDEEFSSLSVPRFL